MSYKILPAYVVSVLFISVCDAAAPNPKIPPIKRITNVKPGRDIFKVSNRKKPLVIKSKKEAIKHFSKAEVAKLAKQVDFKQQFVLIFAWRGSGQDKMQTVVLESYPEQIHFSYKPGRTRDLRPHVYIFALRSNVKWKVQ
ncbi:MAG: hypothetical protein Tsb009_07460 [Planctomycetaceae bacterium]